MRDEKRIEPFLKEVDIEFVITEWFDTYDKDEIEMMIEDVKEQWDNIVSLWKENPDWRFTQLLINAGVIPNLPGVWYYEEEDSILRRQRRYM